MPEDGGTIKSAATEHTNGLMAESTKVNGETITCTDEESIPGQTEDVMKETIKMIKNMGMANTPGQTVASTKANGKMESNMVKESISMLMDTAGLESGNKEREQDGSIT